MTYVRTLLLNVRKSIFHVLLLYRYFDVFYSIYDFAIDNFHFG